MADPDAVKLGYLRQQKIRVGKTTKTVYSNKKSTGGTYTPSPTQAPQAYQAYQAAQQARQAERWVSRQKEQLDRAKRNPQGDVDGDGVPNNIDKNNLVKNNLSIEHRTISKETKAQAERREQLNSRIQNAMSVARESTPLSPSVDNPLAVNNLPKVKIVNGPNNTKLVYALEINKKGQSNWTFSHVEVDGETYTEQVRNPKRIDNPNYKKRLDLNNDGVSGTKKDYVLLSKQKAQEDSRSERSSTTESSSTGGTTSSPGDGSPSSSPNNSRRSEDRNNGNSNRNSTGNNGNNNDNNN